MRNIRFTNNEYYHVFNRGIEKRHIFSDQNDMKRFLQSMTEFNAREPIGSIFENSFRKNKENQLGILAPKLRLVNFLCYCLNPNHFHFLLEQATDKGVEKFLQKLGGGYTNYFNKKYERSGSLFQGTFKAIHVNSNEYLLHLSAYINLNDKVHKISQPENPISKSSWNEYLNSNDGNTFCKKDIILNQFKTPLEYKEFAENSLIDIVERKDMEKLLLE